MLDAARIGGVNWQCEGSAGAMFVALPCIDHLGINHLGENHLIV
jgi:hypothetical protein